MCAAPNASTENEPEEGKPDREPITTPGFFEEELRELRQRLGWTQAEVGQFFGVSKITAHRWERGGAGETEARKAALRLVKEALERSPVSGERLGELLLEAGVVGTLISSAREGRGLKNGINGRPINWKTIFDLRNRLGWTQTEFALFLGVTHSVPAVWESGDGTIGNATRAALQVLDLCSRPGRPEYPEPTAGWDELKSQGLWAFCEEVCELRLERDPRPA